MEVDTGKEISIGISYVCNPIMNNFIINSAPQNHMLCTKGYNKRMRMKDLPKTQEQRKSFSTLMEFLGLILASMHSDANLLTLFFDLLWFLILKFL